MQNGTQRPAAQTLKQRFGFMDEDLTSAKHDEIMLWLDQHLIPVLMQFYPPRPWSAQEVAEMRENCVEMQKHTWIAERRAELEALATAPMIDRPPARIESKTWEYAITNRLNDPIGFIDMRVELGIPYLTTSGGAWRAAFTMLEVCFEAKSHISSLGELFRQIRMYQAHIPRARFIVVSPDDRFADTLRAQGIGFVKYEPEA